MIYLIFLAGRSWWFDDMLENAQAWQRDALKYRWTLDSHAEHEELHHCPSNRTNESKNDHFSYLINQQRELLIKSNF